jgi:hypothetical protein
MCPMAKKKQAKKHKFKYAEPSTLVGTWPTADAPAVLGKAVGASRTGVPAKLGAGAVAATTRDFSYVGADLRRIAVFGISLVILELALWFLFNHTGLGNTVYSFVKV